jgi:hypothetical protein
MAEFYCVPIRWRDGPETPGRGVGNNAAWICRCGEVMLGPYRYSIDPCPGCGRRFRVVRGKAPQFVGYVEETR